MLIYLYFQIPLGILLLYPAFDALKPEWEDAAKTMGPAARLLALCRAAGAFAGAARHLYHSVRQCRGAYASTYALTTGNYNMVTIRIASRCPATCSRSRIWRRHSLSC